MPTSRDFIAEVGFVSHLKSLVTAYEEIAVMRIERVRDSVLAARQFREGLTHVFSKVRTTYQHEVSAAEKKHRAAKGNAKAVVLFSTNTRLSGRVTPELTRYFAKYIDEHRQLDKVVIGQVGKERFQAARPGQPFTFFPLPDGRPRAKDLHPIIMHLLKYASVTIVFPKFQNLIEQAPTIISIGDQTTTPAPPAQSGNWRTRLYHPDGPETYVFEPSLEDVVDFFERQLFSILVQQTAGESWLSLLGSRITAMENASQNITRRLQQLEWERRQVDRRIQSRKQRDRLAGLALWYT